MRTSANFSAQLLLFSQKLQCHDPVIGIFQPKGSSINDVMQIAMSGSLTIRFIITWQLINKDIDEINLWLYSSIWVCNKYLKNSKGETLGLFYSSKNISKYRHIYNQTLKMVLCSLLEMWTNGHLWWEKLKLAFSSITCFLRQ